MELPKVTRQVRRQKRFDLAMEELRRRHGHTDAKGNFHWDSAASRKLATEAARKWSHNTEVANARAGFWPETPEMAEVANARHIG